MCIILLHKRYLLDVLYDIGKNTLRLSMILFIVLLVYYTGSISRRFYSLLAHSDFVDTTASAAPNVHHEFQA